MKAKRIIGRNATGRDRADVTIDANIEVAEKLRREIGKAIHRVNRQTNNKIRYEILVISRENNH